MGTRNRAVADGFERSELSESAASAFPPELGVDADGNALVVWLQGDGTRESIWANRYTGDVWGQAELVEADDVVHARDPQVAMLPDGSAFAVWQQGGCWVRRYELGEGWSTTEPIGGDATPSDGKYPQVVTNSVGEALAVWRDNGELWTNWFRSGNQPPVADAGDMQSLHIGELVQLDGTGSHDAETASEDLVYAWELITVPTGSVAMLSGADAANPTFVPDVLGDYMVSLVVTDEGGLTSEPAYVTISSGNVPPNADAGSDQGTYLGDPVTLNGSGSSDPDGDTLSYAWMITSAPTSSAAIVSNPNTVAPFFFMGALALRAEASSSRR